MPACIVVLDLDPTAFWYPSFAYWALDVRVLSPPTGMRPPRAAALFDFSSEGQAQLARLGPANTLRWSAPPGTDSRASPR